MLPFYWLLSTSFKESDEIFLFPPQWIPRIPADVVQSPFIDVPKRKTAEAEELPLPAGAVYGAAEEAIWTWALAQGRAYVTSLPESEVRPPLTRRMFDAVGAGIPPKVWNLPADQAARQVVARLRPEVLQQAWQDLYRSVALRDLTVEDRSLLEHHPGERNVSSWRVMEGSAELRLLAGGGEKGGRELVYDLSHGRRIVLQASMPVSFPADELVALTLPIRADGSWNAAMLEIEAGSQRLVSSRPLRLRGHIWREVTWRVPPPGGRSPFEPIDYIPLRVSNQQSAISNQQESEKTDIRYQTSDIGGPASGIGHPASDLQLTVTLEHLSRWREIYDKFAANYRDALNYIPFGIYLRNTVLLVILNILGQLFACSFAAYAFARLRWPGREVWFVVLLATMMIPAQVTMVPTFLIVKWLGWYNSLKPLWAPAFFGSAFFIFMLRQFMKTIPRELEDAARIDGCGFFGIYWRIMLPLLRPALAAVAIFTFMGTWNNFMGPLIYLNDQRLFPLALGLYQFQAEHGGEFGMMMAASALMTIPVIAIFFALQRQFIQGVTLTGMKG